MDADQRSETIGSPLVPGDTVASGLPTQPIGFDHIEIDTSKSLLDLRSAIVSSEHSSTIVSDPSFKPSDDDLDWIANRSNDTTIQIYYRQARPTKTYKRVLLLLLNWITRVLLKTSKCGCSEGLVVIPRRCAQRIPPELFTISTSNERFLARNESTNRCYEPTGAIRITSLLAMAHLHGVAVEEIYFGRPISSLQTDNLLSDAVGVGESNNPNRQTINPLNSKAILAVLFQTIQFWWNAIMFPGSPDKNSLLRGKTNNLYQVGAWVLLFIAATTLLFSNLNYPLLEPDEARNAQLAINVIESGDWMSLQLAGEPYWDKPPLQIWAIATAYKVFGVSPMSTRIPGTIATILTLTFTLAIGRRIVGFRAAWLASILLLLCAGFMVVGRYVTMDATLTSCVTLLSLSLFVASEKRFKQKWMLVAGIAAGIGLLTKGPVVLVAGLPPVLLATMLAGNRSLLNLKNWISFAAAIALIAGPWFIATSLVHPDFAVYFFWKHHIVRFSDAFNHSEPFWYYLPVIFVMMFPASYLLPSVFKFVLTRTSETRMVRTPAHGFLALSAFWVIGFFSLSESKLPTYILSALPPLCLLTGVMLEKQIFCITLRNNHSQPSLLEQIPARKSWQLVLFIGIIFVATKFGLGAALQTPAMLAFVAFVAAIVCICVWADVQKVESQQSIFRSKAAVWSCAMLSAFCFMLVSVNHLVPQIASSRSIHAAAGYLQTQSDGSIAPILFYGRENYGAFMTLPPENVFYFESEETDQVCQFLKQNPQSILVSSKTEMKMLRRQLEWTIIFEKSTMARHLYTSRPNPTLTAAERIGLFGSDTRSESDQTLIR